MAATKKTTYAHIVATLQMRRAAAKLTSAKKREADAKAEGVKARRELLDLLPEGTTDTILETEKGDEVAVLAWVGPETETDWKALEADHPELAPLIAKYTKPGTKSNRVGTKWVEPETQVAEVHVVHHHVMNESYSNIFSH